MIGYRKIIILSEGLFAFGILTLCMGLSDAAAILAVGTSIIGMISAAIYGNVKEHQAKEPDEAK
jgi:hypothetical protein